MYLLAGWLAHGGLRRRHIRAAGLPPLVILGHVALAVAGLGIWIAFTATGVPALAWTGVGLILPIAGLGLATLVTGLPEPAETAATGPARTRPVRARPVRARPVRRAPEGTAPVPRWPRGPPRWRHPPRCGCRGP